MSDAAPIEELRSHAATDRQLPGPSAQLPYAPSWVNWLTARIDELPVPPAVAYLAFGAVMVIGANTQDWIAGTVPLPNLTLELSYWGVLAVGLLALMPYLDRVAASSLRSFQPALQGADVDLAALEYEMTVIPARPALIVTGLAVAAVVSGFVSNPAGSGVAGLPPVALAIVAAGWSLVLSLLFLLMYHTLRQLRAVSRIHALAPQINLFRPAPLYAFSQLTVRTSIAFIAIISTTLLINAPTVQSRPLVIVGPFIAGCISVATAAFVVPLLGIHRRITAEKKELEGQVGQRLEGAIAEVHHAADMHDLSQADGLSKQLASLIAERDLVARMPTWPWHPGTFGVFVTAIVLPIGLYVVTRLLQRVV